MTGIRLGTRYDEGPALAVWHAANAARGRPPGAARRTRVRTKLRAPDALLMVAEDDGTVVGMLLAELGRDADGEGPVLPGLLHLSMLFVAPERDGHEVRGALLDALRGRYPWIRAWAAAGDDAALVTYASAGFVPTGRRQDRPPQGELLELEHGKPAASGRPPA